MNFWRKLFKILKPFHRSMATLVMLVLLFQIFELANPYIFKEIIDIIVAFDRQAIPYLLGLIGLMFLANNLISGLDYFVDKKIFHLLLRVERYLPFLAQKKLISLSLGYHERENTGAKVVKVQRGVDRLVDLLGQLSWEFLPTVFQVLITFIVMMILDWQIALVFLVMVPFFLFLTFQMNKRVYPLREKRHESYEKAYGKMGESIVNISTVQSFAQEQRESRQYRSICNFIYNISLKEWAIRLKSNFNRNLILALGRVLVLLFSIFKAYQGVLSLGTLVFVITLAERSYYSLFRISRIYDHVQDCSSAVERLTRLFSATSEIKSPAQAFVPQNLVGQIEFRRVFFSYPLSQAEVLKDISFSVREGEVLALVGPSGGGKSTIVKLLYRHYDPRGGQILIDGVDLRKFDLQVLRKCLAIVPQEVEIFNTTIRENIIYAKPRASYQEIKKAAKIANATEFINQLQDGYETIVGERGVRLSGGQKQRIGIARAVLADPRILIFDEATSDLDSYSESLIREAMLKVAQGRTMIIVAHRLSTIRHADKILVIEDGRIVETGSHRSLKEKGGLYKKLVELQEEGEIK